jgi:leucyl/phenylalanyl-tRNA---protein transferase
MYFLTKELYFPSVEETTEEGILAVGGDLSTERLMLAYNNGIFPWFEEDEPILWWAPEERMVLFFEDLKISKSMRKILDKGEFKVTFNKDFKSVITNCQKMNRVGQHGTWITEDMVAAYCKLHEQGFAKSVEVWKNDELVGGLYGIDLGDVFCGESMFSKVSNASKVAFITLAEKLHKANYKLIDCQVHNNHLESLGCIEIEREEFMAILNF